MKKAIYEVAVGTTGIKELEEKASKLLTEGWKPIGGISFNNGFSYQAFAKVITTQPESNPKTKSTKTTTPNTTVGAIDAMKRVDELT